jgi:phosphoglycerate kinase
MTQHTYTSALSSWDIKGKRIILRADLNVPMHNGMMQNDAKLKELLPTLDYLIRHDSIIILVTHIGRPTGYDPLLSTVHLCPWFVQKQYSILFAATVADAALKAHHAEPGTIIMLENVRFFPGETDHDMNFAQTLKTLGEFYVHDGFACMHTQDTSNTLLPRLFPLNHKTIGFGVEKEIRTLDSLLGTVRKPFVVIVGGSKLKTKIKYIREFIAVADTIIICPALAFTFLKAQGIQVGQSLTDDSLFEEALAILTDAKNNNVPIVLPCDVQIEDNASDYSIVPVEAIPDTARGISLGEKSIETIKRNINDAGTILYNGAIGFLEIPETVVGMKMLLEAIAAANAQTIVAGGDTAAAVYSFGMQNRFTHLSTAGGATLDYVLHKTLPTLQAIFNT